MKKMAHRSEDFSFDDLNWSEREVEKTKEAAEALRSQHGGDIEFIEGTLSYWRSGEPYYNDPSCWPKYIVSWEEEERSAEEKKQKEAMERLLAEVKRMDAMAFRMTNAERLHIVDMGFYNEVIKGYLIRAMKIAGFSREDIDKALDGLRWAFDAITASEAYEEYQKF